MSRSKPISIEVNLKGLMTVYRKGSVVSFVYEDGRSLKLFFRRDKDANDFFMFDGEHLINNTSIGESTNAYCAGLDWHMSGEVNNEEI
jgi:hypothetical protein